MTNTSDTITLLQFYRLESKERWAICRSLQNKSYAIKHRAWSNTKSPLLFVADISVSLFTPILELKRTDEGHVLPELRALLQAMIDLPAGYEYIWAAHWEGKNIQGPGTFLWATVERLARQCLSNTVSSGTGFSAENFTQLVAKMITQYCEEAKCESEIAQSYRSHITKLKKKRRKA